MNITWTPYSHIDDPDKWVNQTPLAPGLYWLNMPYGVIIGRFVGFYPRISETGFVFTTSGRSVEKTLLHYARIEFPTPP